MTHDPANPVVQQMWALSYEVIDLRERLHACRLARANLLAAIYATLRAADAGDSDALAFLCDELPESHPLSRHTSPRAERGGAQ